MGVFYPIKHISFGELKVINIVNNRLVITNDEGKSLKMHTTTEPELKMMQKKAHALLGQQVIIATPHLTHNMQMLSTFAGISDHQPIGHTI